MLKYAMISSGNGDGDNGKNKVRDLTERSGDQQAE